MIFHILNIGDTQDIFQSGFPQDQLSLGHWAITGPSLGFRKGRDLGPERRPDFQVAGHPEKRPPAERPGRRRGHGGPGAGGGGEAPGRGGEDD